MGWHCRSLFVSAFAALLAGLASPVASLASDASSSPHDLLLLNRLLSAKRVTVQRIWGPPPDSCRPELAPPSDTIACYPVTSVARAPKGDWVRQVLELSAGWTWARGHSGIDPMFAPEFGVHFRGDSLDVDWILSLEPLSVMIRVDGDPSTSAVVPEDDHLQLLELMRRPFPKDRELVARHIEEEERHHPQTTGPSGETEVVSCDCGAEPGEGQFVYYEDAPAPIAAPPAEYPDAAREARREGKVFLHVLVDRSGMPCRFKVIRGVPMLDDAAIASVSRWRFKPALSKGEPVCVWVEIPIDFHF